MTSKWCRGEPFWREKDSRASEGVRTGVTYRTQEQQWWWWGGRTLTLCAQRGYHLRNLVHPGGWALPLFWHDHMVPGSGSVP